MDVSRNISGTFGHPFVADGTIYEHQLNYWSPTNTAAEYPRLTLKNNGSINNTKNSTLWIRDADYIRLKTAQVYYNLPESLFTGTKILRGVQFYLSGYNLLTWDKLKIRDPEWDAGTFPVMRNVSIGCTIKI
ncbi:hypothetical protein SDC9_122159 [bioreactor metagenome]|uniref:TonB-dependent receptor SusC n=1 Tax=bioreactor metagenome TaxID=1076179 RepID=A0A645CE29_9ZZZZ